MDGLVRKARIAGALYVLLFTAPLSLIYIPAKLFDYTNPSRTAGNILGHETLFRFGIVSELFNSVGFIFLAFALFSLLNAVDRTLAWMMVILGSVVCAPISFIAVANEIAALAVLKGGSHLSAFTQPQLDTIATILVRLHGQINLVNQVFWGVWLIPLALLIIRSGFIPKIFGYLLIINGAAYVTVSITALLALPFAGVVERIAMIAYTGELWIMLWLLIKGATVPRQPVPAPAAA